MGAVGQVGEGRRQLDLKPLLLGVPSDGLVAPRLVGFPICGEEQAGSNPALLPLIRTEPCLLEMVADPGKAASTPAHRHPGLRQTGFNLAQPCFEDLEPVPPLEALGGAHVAPGPSPALANRHSKAPFDRVHPCLQGGSLRPQVAPPELEGVLGGSCDRAGPPGRGVLGGYPLAARTGGCPSPGIQSTLPAALRQVSSHERNPRWAPRATSTASSSGPTVRRVRIRAPLGRATTNGSAIGRSLVVFDDSRVAGGSPTLELQEGRLGEG